MAQEREVADAGERIEMPAPTVWPFVFAFGMTIGFAGLVTNVIVSVGGIALMLVAIVGWWFEVLPQPHVEHVPVRAPAQRAQPVAPAPEKTAHLEIGKESHRVSLPEEIQPYSAGVVGGVAGGVAMAALAVVYGVVSHGSVWYAINLLAAAVMPSLASAATQQLASFNLVGLVVAILIHGVVSVFVGLLYGVVLPMLPRHPIVLAGVVAPTLWTGVVWATLGIVNPALGQHVNWAWFIGSQFAFGITAGVIVARSEPVKTMQGWPLAERARVQMPRAERKGDGQP